MTPESQQAERQTYITPAMAVFAIVAFSLMGLGELLGRPDWIGNALVIWLVIGNVGIILLVIAEWDQHTPPYHDALVEGGEDR